MTLEKKCLTINAYRAIYGGGRTKTYERIAKGLLETAVYDGRTMITVRSAEALLEAAIAEAAHKAKK